MKKKLLAALLAALLLLSGCQYSVVEDADEQQLLRGNAAAAETATPSPTVEPLQNGSRDGEGESAVSDLQKRLQSLNYLDGEADGIFGEDTQAALEAFQALNGLPETGMLDAGTRSALNSAMARIAMNMAGRSSWEFAKSARRGSTATSVHPLLPSGALM